jgi:hypothetical protein
VPVARAGQRGIQLRVEVVASVITCLTRRGAVLRRAVPLCAGRGCAARGMAGPRTAGRGMAGPRSAIAPRGAGWRWRRRRRRRSRGDVKGGGHQRFMLSVSTSSSSDTVMLFEFAW